MIVVVMAGIGSSSKIAHTRVVSEVLAEIFSMVRPFIIIFFQWCIHIDRTRLSGFVIASDHFVEIYHTFGFEMMPEQKIFVDRR